MTYCLAIKTSAGIVCASNARTNAGVDNVNRYSKMHVFVEPGQRAFVLVAAGNLATTQAVVSTLQRDFDNRHAERSLRTMDFMFAAADYIGKLSCAVQSRHREFNKKATIDPGASFVLGGPITGQRYDTLRRARGDGLRGRFRVCRLLPGRNRGGQPVHSTMYPGSTSMDRVSGQIPERVPASSGRVTSTLAGAIS